MSPCLQFTSCKQCPGTWSCLSICSSECHSLLRLDVLTWRGALCGKSLGQIGCNHQPSNTTSPLQTNSNAVCANMCQPSLEVLCSDRHIQNLCDKFKDVALEVIWSDWMWAKFCMLLNEFNAMANWIKNKLDRREHVENRCGKREICKVSVF